MSLKAARRRALCMNVGRVKIDWNSRIIVIEILIRTPLTVLIRSWGERKTVLSKVIVKKISGLFAIALIFISALAYVSAPQIARANPAGAPQYRNVGPPNGASITEGENLELYAQGYAETALNWAWLSTNETGSWKNYTRQWSDWHASGSNPIIDGDSVFGSGFNTEDSKIVKVGDTYYMFVSSGSSYSSMKIYMLNSSALSGPWRVMNGSQPIISQGSSGWDVGQLRVAGVTYHDGTCYLYYMGTDGGGTQSVGVATSSSAFPNGWSKFAGNPILTPTGSGWESGGTYSLDIERIGPPGSEWYGHYSATDKTGLGGGYWSLGVCYGSSPYGPFTRYAGNPILQRGVGQFDNVGLPRTDIVKIGKTLYGAYEAASTPSPWDFQVGEYSGEIMGDILNTVFSKNPDNPIIAGNAGSALETANPCWWYENGTRYLFVGGGFPSPYIWRYVDLFSSSPVREHDSPMDIYNVTEGWAWSNFTWSNPNISSGTTVQWRIYYEDIEGNVNGTDIHNFTVTAREYDYVDQTSNVDGIPDKGTHSNFTAEKEFDSYYDTLNEQRIGEFGIMDNRKSITISHSYVDGNQMNFPVLINIYDADLHDSVQSSGNDIAFTDSSGNKLDHEIEYFDKNYNGTHSHLVAWVRANLTNTVDTTISMIYGNPSCGSQQNPDGVWDSSYKGVWHLTEDASGTGTIGLYKDSTASNYDGDDFVSATGKTGIIDGGQQFDGSDDHVKVDNCPELGLQNNSAFEAWIKPTTLSGYQVIMRKAPNNALLDYAQENYGVFLHNNQIYFEFYSGGTYRYHETTTANLLAENWHYLVCVYDNFNDRFKIFLNGRSILDESETNPLVNYSGTNLKIGDRAVENGQHFNGYIDEARLSNSVRTASWINTTYQNIHNLGGFLSAGLEESSTSPASYELDLEVQWTNANFTRSNEELCIKTDAFNGSESLQVSVWNTTDSSWHTIMNLAANQWNNISVTAYLTESTFTIQFFRSESTSQHSWNVDCALLRTWDLHDIAVVDLTCVEKTIIGAGYSTKLNVTVTNEGSFAESFELVLTANQTVSSPITVATMTISSLLPGESRTVTFTWSTTGWANGNYTVRAEATPVPSELDVSDNQLTDGWLFVSIPGDINADRKVDLIDVYAVGRAFGSVRNSTDGWYWHSPRKTCCPHSPNCDIDDDGKIDLKDYYTTCKNYGQSW